MGSDDFIVACGLFILYHGGRGMGKGNAILNAYDLVIGPVANDSTLPVIDDYMDGRYTKEEAVRRLLPQNLTDQYSFLSNLALELLTFEGGELI